MPGHSITQTLAGAAEFDGLTGTTGQFQFSAQNNLPPSSRITITTLSYHCGVGASGEITFYMRPVTAAATERILLGRQTQANATDPNSGLADFKVAGFVLPRSKGSFAHWLIEATTDGKEVTASVILDYVIEAFPDTTERDTKAGA